VIRLIGIDVDGTLLDSRGHLPEANRAAIHDAVAAGIHVALVTGRSYPFARPVAEVLLDFCGVTLGNSAVLSIPAGSMSGDTMVIERVERVGGVP
jgi:hypothetical protein